MTDFLRTVFRLKDEIRTGWSLRGVTDPESVADHSWGTALLCLLYADEAGVNADRCIRMALIHDIAEAVTGDIPTRADESATQINKTEKMRREHLAMDALSQLSEAGGALIGPLNGSWSDTQDLWAEYEAAETDVARFVRDMNLVDMCLQAFVYESDGRYDPDLPSAHFPHYKRLDEFFATSGPRIQTDVGRRLFNEIHSRYEDAVDGPEI